MMPDKFNEQVIILFYFIYFRSYLETNPMNSTYLSLFLFFIYFRSFYGITSFPSLVMEVMQYTRKGSYFYCKSKNTIVYAHIRIIYGRL
jgi:hypothetical protein